ncbi:MAG: hypothetical protein MUD08_19135 [Cytophagales bacterium]|nr:hypothetical protein [Cytophagales bacterium]
MSRVKKWFSAEALREIVRQFAGLHRRFPLTMLCSLLATVFLVLYVRAEGRQYTSIDGYRQMHWSYMQFFLTFLLAVPLLFSAEVLSENVSGLYKKLLIKTVPIGVLILFFFSNPLSQIEDQTFLIRFAVLFVAFHLLVAFAPFWNSPHSNGFWQ